MMLINKKFAIVEIKNDPEHKDKVYSLYNGIKRDNIYYYTLEINGEFQLVDCDSLRVRGTFPGAMLHAGWCRLKSDKGFPGFTHGEYYEVLVDAEKIKGSDKRHILTLNDSGYYDFYPADMFDISDTRENIRIGNLK
jgi:hypothetical protein